MDKELTQDDILIPYDAQCPHRQHYDDCSDCVEESKQKYYNETESYE